MSQLCANNKVSRSGLHTQPTTAAIPVYHRITDRSPEQSGEAVRTAESAVTVAKAAVSTATPNQLNALLRAAQDEVDKARRMPGVQRKLATLERELHELRRDAERRKHTLEQQPREGITRLAYDAAVPLDRLAPMNLGMGARPAADGPPATPPAKVNVDVDAAADRAERAAQVADGKSLDDLVADKKAAQRALATALRAKGQEAGIARLKDALRKIQQAEAKVRSHSQQRDSTIDAALTARDVAATLDTGLNDPGSTPKDRPPVSTDAYLPVSPSQWVAEYLQQSGATRDVREIKVEGFTYLYDTTTSPARSEPDNRVIAVHGRSGDSHGERDKSRMAGFPNPNHVDRGHLVSRLAGGGYDLNLVPQDPALNRGHSEPGKVWRELEVYLVNNPGTAFFVRPTYRDNSDYPNKLEFGVQLESGQWRIESFDNRPPE